MEYCQFGVQLFCLGSRVGIVPTVVRTVFLRPAFTAANYYDKLRRLELDVRITAVHVSPVTNRICHVFHPRELFYGERDVNKRSMISV